MADLTPPPPRDRKVLMGTCGWSDQTLLKCGKFYPASVHTAEDRLRHYSTHFPCVEVDTSTYAIPSTASITRWIRCVPKGFLFHFKAFGMFCSKSCPITALPSTIRSKLLLPYSRKEYISLDYLSKSLRDELWQTFNMALQLVHDAGCLGVVLFQFHLSFKATRENQAHIEWCRCNLDSRFSMAVEFRCRDWFTGEHQALTLEWLKEKGLALVAADELQHETFQKDRNQTGLPDGQVKITLPVAWAVTQPNFAYIRVHRREGNQRLLSDAELLIWEKRLKSSVPEELKGPIYFMWGTDWEDQPLINAKNLTQRVIEMVFDWKLAQKQLTGKSSLQFFLKSSQSSADKYEDRILEELCVLSNNSNGFPETNEEVFKVDMGDWELSKSKMDDGFPKRIHAVRNSSMDNSKHNRKKLKQKNGIIDGNISTITSFFKKQ